MSSERRSRHLRIGGALTLAGLVIALMTFAYPGDDPLYWTGRILGIILIIAGVRYLIAS
jgi:hypothetical protein